MALTDKAKAKLNKKLNQKIEQEQAELDEQAANLEAEKALFKIAKKNKSEAEMSQHQRRIKKFEGYIDQIKSRISTFESELTD